MAKTTTCPITQTLQTFGQTFVAADSFVAANEGTAPTNTKIVFTAGEEGSVIKSLMIATDDTSAGVYNFYISMDSGTTKYLLFAIAVAATSGFASGTTVNVDVLGNTYVAGLPMDQSGKFVLPMKAGAILYAAKQTSAVTASKTTHIVGIAEDY